MTQHAPETEPWIRSWLPDLTGMRVLDVGCGQGSLGLLVQQASGGLDAHLVGAEIWEPNVAFVRRFGIYDEVWACDVTECELPPFDVIIACEILEHLERQAGELLLKRLEDATRNCLIVSTPNGPDFRGPIGGNDAEAHLSSWTVEDFRSRGYEVRGVGSFLYRGTHRNRLTALAWHASTPFASRWPRISGKLVAVRRS